MTNSLVSIRIPKKLVEELKKTSEQDHFLDLSEAIRSVVRKKWLQYRDPQAYQLEQLKTEIKERVIKKVEEHAQSEKQEELIAQLKDLRDAILKSLEGKKGDGNA
jgi:Arc/MetJ-type ribon-helix-helix transcriptional regulator